MKHFVRISSFSLIVFIISLFITIPVLAIPPLPSSFYGTVKVNDANVPDGTLIQAVIGDQVYAEGFTQTYQGNSVYALDVPGDDSGTTAQDGGREGDTIQFKIGDVLTDQTGSWHSGTNVTLDLTASSSGPISTPQATPSPIPTQTPIVLIQPSSTPTATARALLTPTSLVPSSPTAVKLTQASATPSDALPSSMPTSSLNDKDNGSGNISPIVIVIVVLLVVVGGIIWFWFLRKRKT